MKGEIDGRKEARDEFVDEKFELGRDAGALNRRLSCGCSGLVFSLVVFFRFGGLFLFRGSGRSVGVGKNAFERVRF